MLVLELVLVQVLIFASQSRVEWLRLWKLQEGKFSCGECEVDSSVAKGSKPSV